MLRCEIHGHKPASTILIRKDNKWNEPDFFVPSDIYILCDQHDIENYSPSWGKPNLVFACGLFDSLLGSAPGDT